MPSEGLAEGVEQVFIVVGEEYEATDIRQAYSTREAAEKAIVEACEEDHNKHYLNLYRVVERDIHETPQEFTPYL